MRDDVLLAIFNGSEAILWTGLAGFVAWRYRNAEWPIRRLSRGAGALLLLFGVSDVIEIQTGAWWRPVGLLMLKAFCVCGLLVCGWRAYRLNKTGSPPDAM
jgi:hypothetical protein